MHSFHFKKLPLSFAEMWQLNSERNPERALRNANDYFMPAHRIEIVKRLPLISLPTAWNSAPGDKYNVKQHLYLKNLKELLLAALKFFSIILSPIYMNLCTCCIFNRLILTNFIISMCGIKFQKGQWKSKICS
jgi:hypothetical protein